MLLLFNLQWVLAFMILQIELITVGFLALAALVLDEWTRSILQNSVITAPL